MYWDQKLKITKMCSTKTIKISKLPSIKKTAPTWTCKMLTHPSTKRKKLKPSKPKVQQEFREMQDKWWNDKDDEVQCSADAHNSKLFFNVFKTIYGPATSGCSPLPSSDGKTQIKDMAGLLECWIEHFSSLLNRPSSVDQNALGQIPQNPIMTELDEPPTLDEFQKAIQQTSSDRASGKDSIPAEIYKAAGSNTLDVFFDILLAIWEK